jgi:hypothetical protein
MKLELYNKISLAGIYTFFCSFNNHPPAWNDLLPPLILLVSYAHALACQPVHFSCSEYMPSLEPISAPEQLDAWMLNF